ncbi:DUF4129 domain-containing protein [Brevibacterium sp. R8603A2]|mgnify:CR=1 FL=1|uniref:Protein-glutamine gamma-glutamyltransferase-like C-terminal domain-containing protein n=1 Tax=Brevibacterium pityocampae TaxID=506594 RepID=A0ABP8JRY2_9MICO|nr:DUF4129 domain-containing protein [Brevibacterium sp. R8603A2]MCK1803899.1 DUF4129 domain-containing protein [Brevibacterium sp. R8603A2]
MSAWAAPLNPDRDSAQRWAEEELSKQEYQEADLTLLQRLGAAISDFFSELTAPVADIRSVWLIVLVVLVVAALAVLVVWRVRRGSGGSLSDPYRPLAVLVPDVDPEELRARARAAAAAGDWTPAVQDATRALLVGLGRAEVIEVTTASTASELTTAAAAARPAEAGALHRVGRTFDDITFGTEAAAEADYERVRELDRRLTAGVRA